jgi:hypothetical protein
MEVLYTIITECNVPIKLISTSLIETYSKVRIYKHLSDTSVIQNILKQEGAL